MIRNVYYEVDGNRGYKAITKLLNPKQGTFFSMHLIETIYKQLCK